MGNIFEDLERASTTKSLMVQMIELVGSNEDRQMLLEWEVMKELLKIFPSLRLESKESMLRGFLKRWEHLQKETEEDSHDEH